MNINLRRSLRIAHRVRQQLFEVRARRITDAARQLERWRQRTDSLGRLNRHAMRAHDERWVAGARRSSNAARRHLRDLSHDLPVILRLHDQIAEVQIPLLRDVIQDLDQIEDEFGAWRLQVNPQRLCVSTQRIVLKDLDLGPFDIQLRLDELGGLDHRQPYDVVAIDPNPASSNEAVTHPHVSDEGLCEGDAILPIRLALGGGRLAEFFMLVRSVLETYNPESPYVRLDQWSGTPCDDCGYRVEADRVSFCDRCDREYCEECISDCRRCETTECFRCLSECPACGDTACLDCLNVCDGCGTRCCTDCLTDYLCPSCLSERNDPDDTPGTPNTPDNSEPHEPAPGPPARTHESSLHGIGPGCVEGRHEAT